MQYKNIYWLILILFSLLVCSFFTIGCASEKNRDASNSENIVNKVLTHDGYAREYITYEPAIYNKNKRMPLLLVLHGGGGKNNQIMMHTQYRFK